MSIVWLKKIKVTSDFAEIKNFSLEFNEGITILCGNKDSGTDMLLKVVGTMIRVESGRVEIADIDITDFSDEQLAVFRRRYIGFIMEQNNLLPAINAYENIILPLELDGSEVDIEFIEQLAEMLEVKGRLFDMPDALTEAEKLKMAYIRALSMKPRIIVVDDISKYLNKEDVKRMFGIWRMTVSKYNQSIIIKSCDDYLLKLADHVIELDSGKIMKVL